VSACDAFGGQSADQGARTAGPPVAQQCEAVVRYLLSRHIGLGDPGSGQIAKLFNNALSSDTRGNSRITFVIHENFVVIMLCFNVFGDLCAAIALFGT
jgi:hypothetical protein